MAELRVVEGFLCSSEEEYQDALREQKAAAYLKKQMAGKTAKEILDIYNKILDQKMFHTQVGYAFLYELNRALHRQNSISDVNIRPIEIEQQLSQKPEKKSVSPDPMIQQKLILKVRSLRVVTMILLAIVVAMFGITITGTTPTILDYETKLQDKYAAWEQDLTQREAELIRREAQMNP
mgnify:CR=1 FL=1